jgi:CIC family chloride channel protein
VLTPALGGLAAGLLLWGWQRFTAQRPHAPTDYMEALETEDGQFDYGASLVKSLASLLVVASGSAIGREGAMILLAALAASLFARRFTPKSEWKLWIACGAAAGMASAYHAPLAGSLFIAEILFGTLMLASLGPVVIAAVVALLTTRLLSPGANTLYQVHLNENLTAVDYSLILGMGLLAGLCGPLLMWLMACSHALFLRLKLSPPWQLALGGLIVGLLSLLTPKVWGNGYSVVQTFLLAPPLLSVIAGVFICKLLAVLASSGSGAPGGVFTPTLFVGMATGMLFAQLSALWFPGAETAILLGLAGMATLLAATTHAPIMSALMVCEMTGQYFLLPGLLVACVVASVLSRTLRHDSVYGPHTAESREVDVLR